ncbi:unnamed protein product [Linum trigynum]|uniref:Uncharacterized protein n=1 Tax=Linum trigynum TaxID=586398 RepID=A0AAV2F7B0_9ROSI
MELNGPACFGHYWHPSQGRDGNNSKTSLLNQVALVVQRKKKPTVDAPHSASPPSSPHACFPSSSTTLLTQPVLRRRLMPASPRRPQRSSLSQSSIISSCLLPLIVHSEDSNDH